MPRTLVISNDFPTRQGGIEAFVSALADRFPVDEVVVHTASMPGAKEYDAGLPYPVVRDRRGILLPSRRVRREVVETFKKYDCDRVVFGASAPLALLAPALRAAGAKQIVGVTHSAETWWARVPIARGVIRRAGDYLDTMTFINEYCRGLISRPMRPDAVARMKPLHPGADVDRFKPHNGGDEVRKRLGITPDARVVVCTARVVARKGQDTLIRSWKQVLAHVPGATLLIVGDGPYRRTLDKLVVSEGVADAVIFTGPLPWTEVPPYVDAGDVFAMPSRTRLWGLEPEGLPLAFFEGAAAALPVIVGRSGGAPDAIEEGVTGFTVDPLDPADVARHIIKLLNDPELAARMGAAGRERVAKDWTWDKIAADCQRYLGLPR